jgi:hypothetical protein
MTVQPLIEERVCFGRAIPVAVNVCLQEAAASSGDFIRAERALLNARAMAPLQLEVFVALYKLYFYNGRLDEAERVVRETLQVAAERGGFDPDWRILQSDSADWQCTEGPERIFLYSLKALGFIRLRRADTAAAREVLDVLRRLDPQDQVGADVVAALADAVAEHTDG